MADLQKLQALGIDTEEGLIYCAEDPDFYGEMLLEFAAGAQAGIEELERFFTAQAWDRYQIRAHSIKSTSRMIGAQALSVQAHSLELAAKEGDADAILSAHSPFVRAYQALTEGIRECFD